MITAEEAVEKKEEVPGTAGPSSRLPLEEGLMSWFGNHMTRILCSVQHIRAKDPRTLVKIGMFIEDLEHHFMAGPLNHELKAAFKFLRLYFAVYPDVTIRHSYTALKMVRKIYQALGMTLGCQDRLIPGLSKDEELRRRACRSAPEIPGPHLMPLVRRKYSRPDGEGAVRASAI